MGYNILQLCLVADFETLNYKISQNYEQQTKPGQPPDPSIKYI